MLNKHLKLRFPNLGFCLKQKNNEKSKYNQIQVVKDNPIVVQIKLVIILTKALNSNKYDPNYKKEYRWYELTLWLR